jgi:hypothetical protein
MIFERITLRAPASQALATDLGWATLSWPWWRVRFFFTSVAGKSVTLWVRTRRAVTTFSLLYSREPGLLRAGRYYLATGRGAAWRALYLGRHGDSYRGTWSFHLGIDPTATRPSIFGQVWHWSFRLYLPLVTWLWVARGGYSKPRLLVYKAQQRLLHNLDGRYGWGGSVRRERRSA